MYSFCRFLLMFIEPNAGHGVYHKLSKERPETFECLSGLKMCRLMGLTIP